jgi:hypothetical protein
VEGVGRGGTKKVFHGPASLFQALGQLRSNDGDSPALSCPSEPDFAGESANQREWGKQIDKGTYGTPAGSEDLSIALTLSQIRVHSRGFAGKVFLGIPGASLMDSAAHANNVAPTVKLALLNQQFHSVPGLC